MNQFLKNSNFEPQGTAVVVPHNWLYPSDIRTWFETDQPIELDLGCGKGRFLLARAQRFPDRNFLGIERQLERIRKIDSRIERLGLKNVRLFRVEGFYAVRHLLPDNSLSACYIFHPDPWPKDKHAHHRLLGPEFLHALQRVLRPGAPVHFTTDHLPYYYEVTESLLGDPRWRQIPAYPPLPEERTDFELLFRDQKPIGRYAFVRV